MAEGTFKNGDDWTGYKYQDCVGWWFRAIDQAGYEYDTQEVPATEPLFTLTQYIGNWTGDEVDECQAGVNTPTYGNKAW